jgi:hypothetical protein
MLNESLGRCPLCGRDCKADEELTQIDGGPHGICHVDCIQEAAEAQVDFEKQIERRAS